MTYADGYHDSDVADNIGQTISNSLCLNPTDEYEIMGIISNLNAKKPPGHDELPLLLIKELKYAICSYLTKTINKCLLNGHYPDILKIAKGTLFLKGDKEMTPTTTGQSPCISFQQKI